MKLLHETFNALIITIEKPEKQEINHYNKKTRNAVQDMVAKRA